MHNKLLLIIFLSTTTVFAMEEQPTQITTPQQLLTVHLPPLQKMSDCAKQAGDTTHWFCAQEKKDAFKKEIEQTQLYKDMLKSPQIYAQYVQELFDGIDEYNVSALGMCCKAAPVKDLALTAFFDTDGCCQFNHVPFGNTLLGTIFFCSAVTQCRRNKKALIGIVKSWQKKKVLVEILHDLDDKKNK